jgi:type IV pilus assembly protein PilE
VRRTGFTLLELLVAMAIVALLAAVAWPGYAAIIQRAQRNDARLALLAIQHAEELHFQRFNRYTSALSAGRTDGGLGLADRSSAGRYALGISTSDDGQHYTASATALPQGRQASDPCAVFRIDEIGRRSALDTLGRDNTEVCWR